MSAIHIEGMSLRDWFAGQAMIAIASNPSWGERMPDPAVAYDAYQLADAMLAERQRRLDAAQSAAAPAEPDDLDQMFTDLGGGA